MAKRIFVTGPKAEAVYDDVLLPLFKVLGIVDVRRASEVEYDENKEEWVATFLETGEVIGQGPRRADVLEQEVEWIQRRLDVTHSKNGH